MKEWFLCPICKQKLCMITQKAQGVFLRCKRCKQEVEVKYQDCSDEKQK